MSRDTETGFRFAPEDGPVPRPTRRWWPWAVAAIAILALAAAGVYVYSNPLSAPQWLQKARVLPTPAPTVVYKWRDRAGAWHITDAPPIEGIAFERLEYHRDTNVLPFAAAVAAQRLRGVVDAEPCRSQIPRLPDDAAGVRGGGVLRRLRRRPHPEKPKTTGSHVWRGQTDMLFEAREQAQDVNAQLRRRNRRSSARGAATERSGGRIRRGCCLLVR